MIGLRKKTLSGGLWKGRTTGPTFPRVQLALSYLVLPFQIYPHELEKVGPVGKT